MICENLTSAVFEHCVPAQAGPYVAYSEVLQNKKSGSKNLSLKC